VTWGYTEVEPFGVGTVIDLNGCTNTSGGCKLIGGVAAMFKAFTEQAGLDYEVYLEMVGGSALNLHYNTKRALIDRAWDVVIMNGQTNLDFSAPGNPMLVTNDTKLMGEMFQAQNPGVQIYLNATWSRADLVIGGSQPNPWYGLPIGQMAKHVYAGYQFAAAVNPTIVTAVLPVGLAWNRAMDEGIADPNPYDGISPGMVDLWRAQDHYHAGKYGSYLEALVMFGTVTKINPLSLGQDESVAAELGIARSVAHALQKVATEQLKASGLIP
jgi:hypothetical protein